MPSPTDSPVAPEFFTTKEVADILRLKERKIYELASEGRVPCVKLTGKLLFPKQPFLDWVSRHDSVTPTAPQAHAVRPSVLAGSHDPLLEWAIRESACGLALQLDGSLAGLDVFEQGSAMATGLHVIDSNMGEFNQHAVSTRFDQQPVVLIQWAWRQQGLIVAQGNPMNIQGVADLPGKRLAIRQSGAGASILLNTLLSERQIARESILTTAICRTESEALAAVASGEADAAPGLQCLALQFGLGFVPTRQERFDLLVDRRSYFDKPFQALLAFTRSPAFSAKATQLKGYDTTGLGAVVWLPE